MQIGVKIVGLPGAPPGEQSLELSEGTLAEVKRHIAEAHPNVSLDKVLVGFVNGEAVGQDWGSVALNDGDAIMLVVPIIGG